MTAGKLDLVIEQGATFRRELIWKDAEGAPINLIGYTARMQIRERVSATAILTELTTANGRIVLTPAQGKLTLELSATLTDALTYPAAVYDLEVVAADGSITRLLQGNVLIEGSVTR